MIHAAKELIEAMRGSGPLIQCHTDSAYAGDLDYACRTPENPGHGRAFANLDDGGGRALEHVYPVNCPACLRLMRDATDPVRWDALEERGLAPKLPLIAGAA